MQTQSKTAWLLCGKLTDGNLVKQYLFVSSTGINKWVLRKNLYSFMHKEEVLNAKMNGEQLVGNGMQLSSIGNYKKVGSGAPVIVSGQDVQSIIESCTSLYVEWEKRNGRKIDKNTEPTVSNAKIEAPTNNSLRTTPTNTVRDSASPINLSRKQTNSSYNKAALGGVRPTVKKDNTGQSIVSAIFGDKINLTRGRTTPTAQRTTQATQTSSNIASTSTKQNNEEERKLKKEKQEQLYEITRPYRAMSDIGVALREEMLQYTNKERLDYSSERFGNADLNNYIYGYGLIPDDIYVSSKNGMYNSIKVIYRMKQTISPFEIDGQVYWGVQKISLHKEVKLECIHGESTIENKRLEVTLNSDGITIHPNLPINDVYALQYRGYCAVYELFRRLDDACNIGITNFFDVKRLKTLDKEITSLLDKILKVNKLIKSTEKYMILNYSGGNNTVFMTMYMRYHTSDKLAIALGYEEVLGYDAENEYRNHVIKYLDYVDGKLFTNAIKEIQSVRQINVSNVANGLYDAYVAEFIQSHLISGVMEPEVEGMKSKLDIMTDCYIAFLKERIR